MFAKHITEKDSKVPHRHFRNTTPFLGYFGDTKLFNQLALSMSVQIAIPWPGGGRFNFRQLSVSCSFPSCPCERAIKPVTMAMKNCGRPPVIRHSPQQSNCNHFDAALFCITPRPLGLTAGRVLAVTIDRVMAASYLLMPFRYQLAATCQYRIPII